MILLFGAVVGPLQGGSVEGKVAQQFVADILYAEYYRQMGDSAIKNKQRTATTITEKML